VIALTEKSEGYALDSQVVGLAPAGGEDDAVLLAAEQRRDLGSGGLDRPMRDGAVPVRARGLPKRSSRYGRIASRTSGAIGVVAL
jgi:hypothetical protein